MHFKKQLMQFLSFQIAPILIYCMAHLLFWSCRKQFIISKKVQNVLDTPYLVAFWHGEMIFQTFLYAKIKNRKGGAIVISHHKDGEIAVRTMKLFGLDSIRGSKTKGAVTALIQALKRLKGGENLAITPDGPKGPYHSVANGAVMLAQKGNCPILVFRLFCKNAWQAKSWDKFLIPKPFSRIYCVIADPVYLQNKEMQEAKEILKQKMEQELEKYLLQLD